MLYLIYDMHMTAGMSSPRGIRMTLNCLNINNIKTKRDGLKLSEHYDDKEQERTARIV